MDYYAEAKRIAELLQLEGLRDEASAIKEVIEGGSTATEILMGIRFHLAEADKKASQTVSAQIRSLIRELHKALA